MREHGCYPVFLDAQLVDRYYNGFCNDVLWPLFHYVPLPAYQAGAEKKFDARLWEAYKEANARFADAVLEVWSAGPPTENDSTATSKVPDYVWVHDYHLMRLPLELRRRDARVSVAWFLHTPFPSSEIYRILPYRRAVEGLLHGSRRVPHLRLRAAFFIRLFACVRRVDHSAKRIGSGGSSVASASSRSASIRASSNTLKSRAVVKDSGLGPLLKGGKAHRRDRLDYIKGMPQITGL